MRRRTFLKGSMAACATAASGAWGISAPAQAGERPLLPIPTLMDVGRSGRLKLAAQQGETAFLGGRKSPSRGYGQAYLGPVVRARQGQEVAVDLQNRLDEKLATHWHGLLVPGEMDGGPHQAIAPGESWQPVLPITQPACTAWFHAHTHPRTAPQVYSGLAGVFQVSDGRDEERGLPTDFGVDDLTLVIQDRQFDDAGRMRYEPGMFGRMHGFQGDRILVNGAPEPRAPVPRSVVRLRLLNGSNARIYHLRFEDGRPMHLVASDSGYLPGVADTETLRLAPGERAEVLVDFRDGRPVSLITGPDRNQGGPGMMGMMSMLRGEASALIEGDSLVLSFHPDERKPARIDSIPDAVADPMPPLPDRVDGTRRFRLDMMLGGMPMMSRGGPTMGINGRPFDMAYLNERVRLGAVERWIVESDMLMHPFHVHGVRFRVLSDEKGSAVRMENRGYKDTVLVDGRAEILVEFTQPAAAETPFMYHCHILEHEDAGMMGHLAVG